MEETKSSVRYGKPHNLFAISIRQPFAQLVVDGLKPVENRIQRMNYTGVLLVHASQTYEIHWKDYLSAKALLAANKHISRLTVGRLGFSPHTFQAIIGAVIVERTDTFYQSDWCQQGMNYMWLSNPIKFSTPIFCNGKLKVFRPDITLQQFSYADRLKLGKLYAVSKALGLQKLPISDYEASHIDPV